MLERHGRQSERIFFQVIRAAVSILAQSGSGNAGKPTGFQSPVNFHLRLACLTPSLLGVHGVFLFSWA